MYKSMVSSQPVVCALYLPVCCVEKKLFIESARWADRYSFFRETHECEAVMGRHRGTAPTNHVIMYFRVYELCSAALQRVLKPKS